MTLEDTLTKARDALRSGLLASEAHVSGAVIAPILQALGWDHTDPKQWLPEYDVGAGRVDHALFDGPTQPLVFVEAKRQGNLSAKAETQLFAYATNKGVPILVLTDGATWDLYLSMAAGDPSERRFAHLELTDSTEVGDLVSDLRAFLERTAVVSGRARTDAEARLKHVLDSQKGKSGLAAAWKLLLDEPDEILRDLLMERVEAEVGSRPDADDAEEFLRRQVPSHPAPVSQPVSAWTPTDPTPGGATKPSPKSKVAKSGQQTLKGFVLGGKRFESRSGAAALRRLATEIQRANSSFLDAWADYQPIGPQKLPRAVPAGHGVLSTSTGKRYKQLHDFPQWWLYVNLSTPQIEEHMEAMTRLAGMRWNRDVKPIT